MCICVNILMTTVSILSVLLPTKCQTFTLGKLWHTYLCSNLIYPYFFFYHSCWQIFIKFSTHAHSQNLIENVSIQNEQDSQWSPLTTARDYSGRCLQARYICKPRHLTYHHSLSHTRAGVLCSSVSHVNSPPSTSSSLCECSDLSSCFSGQRETGTGKRYGLTNGLVMIEEPAQSFIPYFMVVHNWVLLISFSIKLQWCLSKINA